jgi:GNAT superfamily N-acetyltransferase
VGLVKLRRAREEDAATLAKLSAEFGYSTATNEMRDRLRALLPQDGHSVWVAEDETGVLGWLHARISHQVESPDYVEIAGLVVTETRRSQGVGAQLVGTAETWARAQGYSLIRLRSRFERERAHRFYERLGYREIKQQKAFLKELQA